MYRSALQAFKAKQARAQSTNLCQLLFHLPDILCLLRQLVAITSQYQADTDNVVDKEAVIHIWATGRRIAASIGQSKCALAKLWTAYATCALTALKY